MDDEKIAKRDNEVGKLLGFTMGILMATDMKYNYLKFSGSTNKIYLDLETRTILESKLYAWCQQFDEEYPGVLHTYYEDDEFVCYYFRQNPRNNYELSFK